MTVLDMRRPAPKLDPNNLVRVTLIITDAASANQAIQQAEKRIPLI